MAQMNKSRVSPAGHTHEGAPAAHVNAAQQLRRSVMACMLWEDGFYEDGQSIAERIRGLVAQVDPSICFNMAVEARTQMNLRHAPLWIVNAMLSLPTHLKHCRKLISRVVQRADEMAELLAMYWPEGDRKKSAAKMPKQLQRGLADAFVKFSEYELAKYNREKSFKLRDVMFLCHPHPRTPDAAGVQQRLANNTLETPDTWEVALSAGKNKRETFTRLITEQKLGALAMLRNLRNMIESGVDKDIIKRGLEMMQTDRVLPFRFIAAARYAPQFEPQLEQAMLKSLLGAPSLPGQTALLVDVSGSMDANLSGKSEMTRMDAACGLAVLLREICGDIEVVTFSDNVKMVPPRRGFALRDAIIQSQPHSGTRLGYAVDCVRHHPKDRVIVLTDEQSADRVDAVTGCRNYMINVAAEEKGVGYGPWTRISGWSESIVRYIQQSEIPTAH